MQCDHENDKSICAGSFSVDDEIYKLTASNYRGFDQIMNSWPDGNVPDNLYEYCSVHQEALINAILETDSLEASLVKLQIVLMEFEIDDPNIEEEQSSIEGKNYALIKSAARDLLRHLKNVDQSMKQGDVQ